MNYPLGLLVLYLHMILYQMYPKASQVPYVKLYEMVIHYLLKS